jgi:tetratricopeptide (TPR) repeat protein
MKPPHYAKWILLCFLFCTRPHAPAEPKTIAETPAGTPVEIDNAALASRALKTAFVLRQIGEYEDALIAYGLVLRLAPNHPESAKIRQEIQVLDLLRQGWAPKSDDSYSMTLALASSLLKAGDEAAKPLILSQIEAFPDRWEAYALLAQCEATYGNVEAGIHALERAREVGGVKAEAATALLAQDLSARKARATLRDEATELMEKGELRNAAGILEEAWKRDPTLVEFGLQAANLRSRSGSYSAAAEICEGIADFLMQHPTHPLASSAAQIAATAKKAREASELADAIAREKKAVRKKSPSKSGRKDTGSMSEKFKARTQ